MIRTLIVAALATFALQAFAAVEANQANLADLETVKGIGPGLAGKILEARKVGSFKNWGDLVERVGGIGAGNATRLSQAGLTVAGAAYDGTTATTAKAGKGKKARKSDKATA
jgi:competence protein ComEA